MNLVTYAIITARALFYGTVFGLLLWLYVFVPNYYHISGLHYSRNASMVIFSGNWLMKNGTVPFSYSIPNNGEALICVIKIGNNTYVPGFTVAPVGLDSDIINGTRSFAFLLCSKQNSTYMRGIYSLPRGNWSIMSDTLPSTAINGTSAIP